jgi:hypothetical protein
MTANRLQHIVPAGIVFTGATVVTWLSFTQEPAESFLFPRVISVFFITLAAWNFTRAITGLARVGTGFSTGMLKNMLPGLLVMLVYIFFAAKGIGFYLASTLAFFAIYTLYDPAPYSSVKDWTKRGFVTAAFMAIIYGLFALVLQVQTPRGLFI